MKTYETIHSVNFSLDIGTVTIPSNTSYAVPYERNDSYLRLANETDPRNPESLLEPEMGKLLYADVDFEYNYYAPQYERYTTEFISARYPGISILDGNQIGNAFYVIPSLNTWLLRENGVLDNRHAQFFNNMYGEFKDSQSSPNIYENTLSRDWFEYRLQSLENLNAGSPLTSFFETLQNQHPGSIFPEFINLEMANVYHDRDNKREMFPYFAKFKLSGVEKNEFSNLLQIYELEDDFVDFLVMHRAQPLQTFQYRVVTEDGVQDQVVYSQNAAYSHELFKTHITAGHGGNIITYNPEQSNCEYFESFLKTNIFINKLEEYVANAEINRRFPVAFRLVKKMYGFGQDTSSPKHSTTHYFFNYNDLLEFKLYDTQIAYGHKFDYELRVINAMVVLQSSNRKLVFLEEPYYEESIKVLDSPPIAPDVELLTYRGIDNKVLILFNQMVDKKVAVPVIVNESDIESFTEQRDAQKIQQPLPIIFESDDPTDFELFKTLEMPQSYEEFANTYYRVIRSNGETSAAFEDTIIPNQVYYYMFRAQDMHGFVSNPSPIYEFVLVKEGETLYPRTRIVDLKKPDPPVQKSKSFKKYLKIGFSPRQYTVSSQQIQNINDDLINSDIPIGISEDDIIGSNRTFKFRIRSKNTGKLIDINVTFKKNKVIKA